MKLPKSKTTEIIESELDEELMLYDLANDKAYTLNETLKIVYKACDGKSTFDDLKRASKFTDELIYLSLDELKKKDLLEEYYASPFAGISRREVIRRVGFASMIALPVISSLVAPTAANAASPTACARRGGTCFPGGQNLCAGRANQTVTFYYYELSAQGACRGTDTGISNPDFQCGNTAPTTPYDICRVG